MKPVLNWSYVDHDEATGPLGGLDRVVTRVQFSIMVTDADWRPPADDPKAKQPVYVHASSRDIPEPAKEAEFVPGEKLRGAMLLEWAKAGLGEEACALYERDAVLAYQAQHSPPTKTVRLEN